MKKEDSTLKGIPCDTLTKRKGIYILRKSFYYRTSSSFKIAELLKQKFPNVEIIDTFDKFVAFRGGDSIAKGSHYRVDFKIVE